MKLENEVKYKIKNIKKIKDIIKSLGFKFKNKTQQTDYYFSPPHKSFKVTRKYYLRLRKEENKKSTFGYYIAISNLKTKEFEVEIDNPSVFLDILKLLGFKLDCIVNKKRETYHKNNINIMTDAVKGLGLFIEIEHQGNFTKKIENKFNSLIKGLNLNNENKIINLGYPDLLINHD